MIATIRRSGDQWVIYTGKVEEPEYFSDIADAVGWALENGAIHIHYRDGSREAYEKVKVSLDTETD